MSGKSGDTTEARIDHDAEDTAATKRTWWGVLVLNEALGGLRDEGTVRREVDFPRLLFGLRRSP